MDAFVNLIATLIKLALDLATAFHRSWRLAVVIGIGAPMLAFALHSVIGERDHVRIDSLSTSIDRKLADGVPRTREDLQAALAIEGDVASFERALADRVKARVVQHKLIEVRDEFNRTFQTRVYYHDTRRLLDRPVLGEQANSR